MVLILAIGDLHFKKDFPHITDLVMTKIKEKIQTLQPDIVVILGDTLDTHEKIDMKTQNKAGRFIKEIAAERPVVVLIGNHDRPDSTTYLTEDSCFYLLKGFQNIHIVDRVMSFKFETEGTKEKLRFVFVPYVSPGTFHEALDTLEDKVMIDKPVAIFCHQEFRKGHHGDEWAENNPILISGHIHTFSQPQTNIIYPGTPYQISFNDQSAKGILICEFLPGKSPQINFLELNIRKKMTIKIAPKDVANFVPPPNCDVKVVIQGEMSDLKAIRSTGALATMTGRGVNVSLDIQSVNNPGNPDGKCYKDLLLDMLKQDDEAIKVLSEIFSNQNKGIDKYTPVPVTNLVDLLKSAQTLEQSKSTVDTSELFAKLGLQSNPFLSNSLSSNLSSNSTSSSSIPLSNQPIQPLQIQQQNPFQQFQQSAPITVSPALAPLQALHTSQSPIQNNVQNVLQQFNPGANPLTSILPKPLLPPTQDPFSSNSFSPSSNYTSNSSPFQLNQQNPILNSNFTKQESAISQTGRTDILEDPKQKVETKATQSSSSIFGTPSTPAIFRLGEDRKPEAKEPSNNDLKASLVASALAEKNKPNSNLDLLASLMQQGTKK
jgi:predicted phosphodiesterase